MALTRLVSGGKELISFKKESDRAGICAWMAQGKSSKERDRKRNEYLKMLLMLMNAVVWNERFKNSKIPSNFLNARLKALVLTWNKIFFRCKFSYFLSKQVHAKNACTCFTC
jgi:hypothetical protein